MNTVWRMLVEVDKARSVIDEAAAGLSSALRPLADITLIVARPKPTLTANEFAAGCSAHNNIARANAVMDQEHC